MDSISTKLKSGAIKGKAGLEKIGDGTMDVLFNLRNRVSNALPGNICTRDFEILKHTASYGPGLLWKIYDANKKSTKQEASVFVFEKKQLDKLPKHEREMIIDVLRKGVSQITKLRHPKILSVMHPLEESREGFGHGKLFMNYGNGCDNRIFEITIGNKEYNCGENA